MLFFPGCNDASHLIRTWIGRTHIDPGNKVVDLTVAQFPTGFIRRHLQLFVPISNGFDQPAALVRTTPFSNRVGAGLDPCGALQTPLELEANESVEIVFLLGKTVNSLRTFNSNALLKSGGSMDFSVLFTPAAVAPEEKSFSVGPNTSWITASATVETNTVALVLTSPTGERYGSAISLPELGSTAVVPTL